MKFRPPEKQLIVKMPEDTGKIKGGIHIVRLGPQQGVVVAAGKDSEYAAGDIVLYHASSGIVFEFEDLAYIKIGCVSVIAALEA